MQEKPRLHVISCRQRRIRLDLSLPNDDIAVQRVASRVAQGGHSIPELVIRRRFKAGLHNFHTRYSKVVDSWALYDSYVRPPKLIDWSDK